MECDCDSPNNSHDTLVPYLSKYGYTPVDAKSWKVQAHAGRIGAEPATPGSDTDLGSTLELKVLGHDENEGHTWYKIECTLLLHNSTRLTWLAPRRLVQLREGLHDPIKGELADCYSRHFAGAPFAHKGGLPGTTSRLEAWCCVLASCCNTGVCSPAVVGLTLAFLEPPEPPSMSGNAKKAVSIVAERMRMKMENAKTSMRESAERMQTQYAETAAETGMKFAKDNPKMAQMGGSYVARLAKQNPQMAQSAGQASGKAALKIMKDNPKMALGMMRLSAKTATSTI